MGLFRKNRPASDNDKEDETKEVVTDTVNQKIHQPTIVILEFPPNFDPAAARTTTAVQNPKIIFQHDSDSIVSDVSNCSCRNMHGHRRPDICLCCAEMKEAMRPAPQLAKTNVPNATNMPQPVPSMDEDPTFSMSESSNSVVEDHRVPPAITLLSKMVPTPRRKPKDKCEIFEQLPNLMLPPESPSPRISRKLFQKHRRSATADAVVLGHELA